MRVRVPSLRSRWREGKTIKSALLKGRVSLSHRKQVMQVLARKQPQIKQIKYPCRSLRLAEPYSRHLASDLLDFLGVRPWRT